MPDHNLKSMSDFRLKAIRIFRRYRGWIILVIGLGLIGTKINYDPLKELGSAMTIAGILILAIDEFTKQEIIETIQQQILRAKYLEVRSFVLAHYGRDVPDHVWRHCEKLFQADFMRGEHEAIYTLEVSSCSIEGVSKPAMKITADYEFDIQNISRGVAEYESKYRLEVDGMEVSPTSLKELVILKLDLDSHQWKEYKKYSDTEIIDICKLEKEFEDDKTAESAGESAYYRWTGKPISVEAGGRLKIKQKAIYFRDLSDTDKFLSSASARKLIVSIFYPIGYKLLAFNVSQNNAKVKPVPSGKIVTLEDVTPYQGIVFSWSKLDSLVENNGPPMPLTPSMRAEPLSVTTALAEKTDSTPS